MTTREEDYVERVFTASTHDYILFFTNLGKVHRRKGYQIPEAGRTAKGTNLVNILPFEPGEKVSAMLHVRELGDITSSSSRETAPSSACALEASRTSARPASARCRLARATS